MPGGRRHPCARAPQLQALEYNLWRQPRGDACRSSPRKRVVPDYPTVRGIGIAPAGESLKRKNRCSEKTLV